MASFADPLDLPSGVRLPTRIAKAALGEALGPRSAERTAALVPGAAAALAEPEGYGSGDGVEFEAQAERWS